MRIEEIKDMMANACDKYNMRVIEEQYPLLFDAIIKVLCHLPEDEEDDD